ncbi:hypothetical protein K458DRAFT_420843 [Lentithecium fluviatile CBS 122367]|uniref:NB-ARC domain-containing protein n=1 Tax=Lentithecium fluviatile CBS 122367 TaxID=1168545 RepID=A0A6G1ITR5_9PLEO|nr:hypothetical protein K458DRAFT_420843 [Lentithecium fluviatile CBS 122367]
MLRWLSVQGNRDWLLILDNVDAGNEENLESDVVNRYIPKVDHGNVIVTSRVEGLRGMGKSFPVSKMNQREAEELLQSRINATLPAYEAPSAADDEILEAKLDC